MDCGSQTPIWIVFKYERLPNICFTYGKFDHDTRLCPECLSASCDSSANPKFGSWLRADHYAVDGFGINRRSPPSEPKFKPEESPRMNRTASENMKWYNVSEKATVNDSLLNSETAPIPPENVTVNSSYPELNPVLSQ